MTSQVLTFIYFAYTIQLMRETLLAPRAPKKDLLPQPFTVIDLLTMDQDQAIKFKQQVNDAWGNVIILVHPYFREDNPHLPAIKQYAEQRDQLIKQSLAKRSPLILLEETGKYPELIERFANQTSGTIFTVQTIEEEATPDVGNAANTDSAWNQLLKTLKEAGITHASVGGKYLILQPASRASSRKNYRWFQKFVGENSPAQEWLGKNLTLEGCVGQLVYSLLGYSIDTSLSPASYPASNLNLIAKKNRN